MSVTLRVSGSRPLRMKPEKQTATRGQVLTHSAREALDGTQRHAGIFVSCGGRNPRGPNPNRVRASRASRERRDTRARLDFGERGALGEVLPRNRKHAFQKRTPERRGNALR